MANYSNNPPQHGNSDQDENSVYICFVPGDMRARVGVLAQGLLKAGFSVRTPWWGDGQKDGAPPAVIPDEDEDLRAKVQKRNITELALARYVLAVTDTTVPNLVTYTEIGAAIGYKKQIVWTVEKGGRTIYDARDTVLRADTDADVLTMMRMAVRLNKARRDAYYDLKNEQERERKRAASDER